MMHQLVLFDLGGVVFEVESDRLVHQVAQGLGRPFEEVQEAVYHPELLLPFELGRITATAYYEGLKKRLALRWTYEQFARAWTGIFTENTDVTALMQQLRKRHRLMALTNTNTLHLDYIKASFPSLAVLEAWVASCDVGLRKPDPQFYRLALERAGVRPSEAVYVDDRPEMVEAGRAVGLTAVRFQNGKQLAEDFLAIGLAL
ncbi:MAG: HAD family phosphatase [Candidatus Omnitrophica bacterium]|nr:HAD family phosphatase [Candidatus Omnitrophota bacterium]